MMTEEQLRQFKEALQRANDSLTKKDFEVAWKACLDLILEIEAKNDKKFLDTLEDLKKQIGALMNASESNFADLKIKFSESIEKSIGEMENLLNFVRDKARTIKDGKDGKDADETKIVQEASKLTIEALKPLIPILDTPEQVRDKLETLEGSDRLKIEAIDKLREELDELKKRKVVVGSGFNYGAMDIHIVDDETPTGLVNGANTDFVLNHIPSPATSLKVFLDGQRMKLTTDYTFSGQTITFLTAPLTNSILTVDYRI